MNEATLSVDSRCALGEGPQWCAAEQRLYWCDILGRRLHWLAPDSGEQGDFVLDFMVSLAAPLGSGGLLLVGEDRLARLDTASGRVETLMPFEADNAVTRGNDGRVDRHGSLWLSSMGKSAEAGAGSIYRLHRGELVLLRLQVSVPNALCFSPQGDYAWFTDTATGVVMRWRLDAEGWPQGEPEPWADFSGQPVNPDGAVVDAEGCVWLALWGAGRVVRLDHQGRHIDEVCLPVSRPTCPAFGGKNLERFYITTAREGLSATDLEQEPRAGGLFEATVGVAGLAEPPLRLG